MIADVVVIGGGIIGLSVAYHIAVRGGGARVVVLERAAQPGTGETAKATGGIRHQFSTEVNVRLTQLSLPAYRRFEEEMGVPVDLVQSSLDLAPLSITRFAGEVRTEAVAF